MLITGRMYIEVVASSHVLPQVHILVTRVYYRKAPDGFPDQPPLAFDSICVDRRIHWINKLLTVIHSSVIPATPLWQVQVLINPGLVAYHARARFYPPINNGPQSDACPIGYELDEALFGFPANTTEDPNILSCKDATSVVFPFPKVRFVDLDRQTDATDGDIIVCYDTVAHLPTEIVPVNYCPCIMTELTSRRTHFRFKKPVQSH
ncbi:unnamed protein product [Allacma fusca]|uniref:Uncharacterized protein n=1 Tax=Allacma fusca TaxID=39272 RepID=A0A8J2NZL5_9HEXA|nr:unnamed protein product [Allacma fusca]